MLFLQRLKKQLNSKKGRQSVYDWDVDNSILERQLGAASTTPVTRPKSFSNSALLGRLPLEIRQQIWTKVVAGKLFHMCSGGIRIPDASIGRYLCQNLATDASSKEHVVLPRCQGSQREPCFLTGLGDELFQPLSLLLTCRQIYGEAVPLLYAGNIFNFDTASLLATFMTLVKEINYNNIRIVHVNIAMWKIRSPDVTQISVTDSVWKEWASLWRSLANLKGLQHLRLDIYGTSRSGLQSEDLEPLHQLRGLKTFDLAVWRSVTSANNSSEQDLALSVPLLESIRSRICN
ncbi:MAG: hypothetical protein Q9209_004310 [Squamulea sp. 1 TL-2023]